MVGYDYCNQPNCWAMLWLVPMGLAHCISAEWRLFVACMAVHMCVSILCTCERMLNSPPTSEMGWWISDLAWAAVWSLRMPLPFWIPTLDLRGEAIFWSLVCAPIYGFVGVLYARTCVLTSRLQGESRC
jgi:hypothetical protein